ncbi:MAG: IS607 family transposase [Desulfurococcales archaeon ex4484_217_2]|nr:MAG: IS607 family transposase [Desulfurococcales archaeon ex4484_217_2]
MSEKLYRTREVAELLNISVSGVKKWIKEGKLRAIRVGRFWMVPESEVRRILSGVKPNEVRAVIYARVSSHKQKKDGNLDRQVERLRNYCSAKGYKVVDIITDVASGLKEDRGGLRKLFDIVENHQADVVVVEFRDRLTRFGFDYLKRYFESHGVRVEVVEETEKGYMEELIEDFVAIVISFAGRIYGKRSQKFKKIEKVVEEVVKDD